MAYMLHAQVFSKKMLRLQQYCLMFTFSSKYVSLSIHIFYEIFKWLPRPQAAAAAIRAILAWVSSLTSVHSSQHCWCNWPLEKINHRLQMVKKANPDLFNPMFTVIT